MMKWWVCKAVALLWEDRSWDNDDDVLARLKNYYEKISWRWWCVGKATLMLCCADVVLSRLFGTTMIRSWLRWWWWCVGKAGELLWEDRGWDAVRAGHATHHKPRLPHAHRRSTLLPTVQRLRPGSYWSYPRSVPAAVFSRPAFLDDWLVLLWLGSMLRMGIMGCDYG